MLRFRLEADGKQKFLVTDAKTVPDLLSAVQGRLGLAACSHQLRIGPHGVVIEDDDDVATLRDDDLIQVQKVSKKGGPAKGLVVPLGWEALPCSSRRRLGDFL